MGLSHAKSLTFPYISDVIVAIYFRHMQKLNSLPNNKILDLTKLEAIAADRIIVAQILRFVFDRAGDIVGKGENAG